MENSYFNKNLNISYLDENIEKPDLRAIIKHYVCSIFVYSFIMLLFLYNPFFKQGLTDVLKTFLYILYYGYILIAPVIYILFRPKSVFKSHNVEICEYIKRIFIYVFQKKESFEIQVIKPNYMESQSLMLMFIKVFFGSLMVKGLFDNIIFFSQRTQFYNYLGNIMSSAITSSNIKELLYIFNNHSNFIYINVIIAIFTIDLLVFAIGYLTELKILNNKIRMVETSAWGIFFCLICYTPFNAITTNFLGWNQSNNSLILGNYNPTMIWILRFVALFFLIIYVSASVALGTKASNLTNRGTVSAFPYNIVRHPAYISKNMFWLCTTIPTIIAGFNLNDSSMYECITRTLAILLTYFAWFFIYIMRAFMEERFLSKDPDYIEYCKKVKYRFIPYIY